MKDVLIIPAEVSHFLEIRESLIDAREGNLYVRDKASNTDITETPVRMAILAKISTNYSIEQLDERLEEVNEHLNKAIRYE